MKMQPTAVHMVIATTYVGADGKTDEHRVTVDLDLTRQDFHAPSLAKVLGVDEISFERTSMAAFVLQRIADMVTRLLSAHTVEEPPADPPKPKVVEAPMPAGDLLN